MKRYAIAAVLGVSLIVGNFAYQSHIAEQRRLDDVAFNKQWLINYCLGLSTDSSNPDFRKACHAS